LWITDAYFAGIPSYVQALRAAAHDGVDVRLLIPGATDIPLLRPLSQAGFRPLLEAGVRLFEWKGSMLHAKTAVADGRLARVGSSNLNISSWMANLELDAVVEDAGFAEEMERAYLADLENATEIVLPRSRRRGAPRERPGHRGRPAARPSGASAGRAAAGALRIGNTVGAASVDRRGLAPHGATVPAPAGPALPRRRAPRAARAPGPACRAAQRRQRGPRRRGRTADRQHRRRRDRRPARPRLDRGQDPRPCRPRVAPARRHCPAGPARGRDRARHRARLVRRGAARQGRGAPARAEHRTPGHAARAAPASGREPR